MKSDTSAVVEQRIECESGKLLFRACSSGVKVWCEKHKREELFTWGQLQALERSFMKYEVTLSDHTTVLSLTH